MLVFSWLDPRLHISNNTLQVILKISIFQFADPKNNRPWHCGGLIKSLHVAVNAPLPFVNGNLHDDTEPGWEDKNKGILAASRA